MAIANQVIGTGSSDVIHGTPAVDEIWLLAGNDRAYGYLGDDVVAGGSGADTVYGGGGDDLLLGGDNNDLLYGQDGDDHLFGNDGFDRLYGGAGEDRLYGGNGADALEGGDGSDALEGGGGDDRLNGRDGDDDLAGGDGNDWLTGDSGNDTLQGGAGRDTIVESPVLIGGAAKDVNVLSGGDGDDRLTLIGTDLRGIFTADLSETLDGGGGNDILSARVDVAFRDGRVTHVLDGGAGDDRIESGIVGRSSHGMTAEQRASSGEGDDLISLVSDVSGGGYGAGANSAASGDLGNDTISVDVKLNAAIAIGTMNELQGGWGNDSLILNVAAGEPGVDIGYANISNYLFGDLGDDRLQVTMDLASSISTLNLSTRLDGENGNDTISGSSLRDDIVLRFGQGLDTITNFQVGTDRFDIEEPGIAFADLTLRTQAGGTLILDDQGQQLAFAEGVTNLSEGDFIFS